MELCEISPRRHINKNKRRVFSKIKMLPARAVVDAEKKTRLVVVITSQTNEDQKPFFFLPHVLI